MKKIYLFTLMITALYFTSCNTATQKEPATVSKENHTKIPKQDRIDLAMEQEFYMTVDPATGTVPRERLKVAEEYKRSLINNPNFRTNAITWQERGPSNVGGRTRALFIDKRDATGNTIFAGSVGGGIWKATNFKTSVVWTSLGANMNNIAIGSLAQDPTNQNTMYAGTGEGWFNSDAVKGDGIWKSIDGGNTWVQLASTGTLITKDFEYIQDIVVTNAGIVYAAARSGAFCNNGGVLRSADGGTTWTRVIGTYDGSGSCNGALNFRGADLEIAANGDLYATTGFQSGTSPNLGRIFRSPVSLGAAQGTLNNWNEITPAGTWRRIEIACAPSNANVIYALLQANGNGAGGISRSDDNGSTWNTVNLPTRCSQGTTGLTDFTNGQAWYDLIIQVDGANSNTVLVGGIDLHKSTDGGLNWTQTSQWAGGCGYSFVHADQQNLIFYPGSSTEIISTNDGGIFYSSNGGSSWGDRNNGYNVTQYYACDLHPTNPNFFLAGAQDNGTQRFQSPGINATTTATGGDGAYCHIDQTDGVLQITSYVYNNYYYSRNSGASFSSFTGSNTGRFINPTDYDDANDVLYSARSANQIGVVTGIAGTTAPVLNTVSVSSLNGTTASALKVDPNVSNGTVWVAGSGTASPVLVKLSNAHTLIPTVETTATLSIVANGSYVSSIDVKKNNSNHILVTLSNYGVTSVLESTDGGSTFNSIEGNLPDMPVRWGIYAPPTTYITDGTTAGGIILGTETGIWATSLPNGFSTVWTPQNTGMPSVSVDMLQLRHSDNTVAAATHGRGLWTAVLPTVATAINPVANTKGFIQFISADKNRLFVSVGNLTVKNIEIQVCDMMGRQVMTKKTNYTNQTINISSLSSGGYVIKVYGDKKERYTQQFVK